MDGLSVANCSDINKTPTMALWRPWPASGWRPVTAWRAEVNDRDISGAPQDAELMRRIRAGDRTAFLEFYDRYAPLLLSVAARVLGNRTEAEDVVQDVCTQLWRDCANYDAALGTLSGWAVTLARNKAIDRVRAASRRRRLNEEVAVSAELPEPAGITANEVLFGPERAARVRAALDELPAEQRQVIALAFFTGLSQSEIALRLQQPLGTVKARIRRGMLKLREQLGDLL
jgi:RNA polymerase sigma-70 factor (ECF subfamily)